MSLAQIATLELFLREKFTFLGQIQTTHFLPGCDLTSLSCAGHTTQFKACPVHFQGSQRCHLLIRRCFICLGNGALWSASTSTDWLRPQDFLALNKATINKLEWDFRGSLHTMDHWYDTNTGRKTLWSYSIVCFYMVQHSKKDWWGKKPR